MSSTLGIVSQDGIQGDPAKFEAVRNWPVPKNVKEVRQSLGFTGYYHWFVKEFRLGAELH